MIRCRTFSQYVDAIIIRHSEDNYYEELIGKIPVPLINGGDGCQRRITLPSPCWISDHQAGIW